MNIASFALAAAFAAVLGYAQPASAQTQDRTGATTRSDPGTGMDGAMMNHGSMMKGGHHGAATNGIGNDERSGNGRDDDDNAAAAGRDDGNQTGRRSGNEHMHMGMGRMWRQRQMMHAMGGAQFHFARGKTRIDVRCSVQEDTQACVRGATELLDAIAQLRNGRHDDRSGAATGDGQGETNGSAAAPNGEQDQDAPGERM